MFALEYYTVWNPVYDTEIQLDAIHVRTFCPNMYISWIKQQQKNHFVWWSLKRHRNGKSVCGFQSGASIRKQYCTSILVWCLLFQTIPTRYGNSVENPLELNAWILCVIQWSKVAEQHDGYSLSKRMCFFTIQILKNKTFLINDGFESVSNRLERLAWLLVK